MSKMTKKWVIFGEKFKYGSPDPLLDLKIEHIVSKIPRKCSEPMVRMCTYKIVKKEALIVTEYIHLKTTTTITKYIQL